MKKITLLFFLGIASLSYSQGISIPNTWKSKVNSTFQGLDKARVPHGILLDYAMEFTNVPAYNGQLTDSTAVDINVFGNIYKTLFMGRVTADTLAYPRFKTLATNWVTERKNRNQTKQNTIVLAGMYYKYAKIDSNALGQNRIAVTNNKYYDKYINGVWQNPYQVKETVAFAPAIQTYNKAGFKVVLPQELMLSNQVGSITKIEFNANDGHGYRQLNYGQALPVYYNQNGIYEWDFKIKINNAYYLYSKSFIKIDAKNFVTGVPLIATEGYENNVFIPGPAGSEIANGGILRIDYAPSHNGQLVKPFIVAEGFDTGSITKPETEGGDRTLLNFIGDINTTQEAGDLSGLLNGNSQTYDIVYIDWQNGVGRIQDNSVVLENALDWVNQHKVSNEPNVLLGQSMGGLIGRYTLARMEQKNPPKPHDVRLFVSHDAPLQGSNTPLSTQFFSRHMYNTYVSSPSAYGLGEAVVPLVWNLIDLITNAFGNDLPPYITPEDIFTLQDTPAAVQQNYEWVTFDENVTTALHDAWQQEFDAMGYPQNCHNVAISNGNECAVDHGFNPGNDYIAIHDVEDPKFLGDLLHLIIAPTIGGVIDDFALHLLGQLPGSSKYFYDFDIKSAPNTYDSNRNVYHGKVRYEKKLLWVIPISHTITERSKDATSTSLPYGSYSGGEFDLFNVVEPDSLPGFVPEVIVVNRKYGFIPVVSSLDVRRNGGVTQNDYLNRYSGGIITKPGLSTQFDNFIVDYTTTPTNNEHISFQVRNGNWLARELEEDPNNISDCSFFCDNMLEITGNGNICSTATYSVPANNGTTEWIVSPYNAGTFSGQNTNQIMFILNPNFTGSIDITATVTIPDCDSQTISKTIFGGKPKIMVESYWDPTSSRMFMSLVGQNESLAQQGVTANSVFWGKISSGNRGYFASGTGLNRIAILPQNNSYVNIEITASNSCGDKAITFFATPPAPIADKGSGTYDFVSNPNNLYTINYIEEGVLLPMGNIINSQQDFKITAYDFTGNPVLETTETEIDLSSLKPGIYILKAIIDDNILTKKVIK
jgi:pimeloyl-ACP methyl ester carboxylesterase